MGAMDRPVIGITTACGDSAQSLERAYVDAVVDAGGCPLILPMTADRGVLQRALAQVGAVVVPGGPGVMQGLIGALPEDLAPVPPRRWESDWLTLEAAVGQDLPVLGICYGMQLLNAFCGGGIYADVQRQCRTKPHAPRRNGGHPVTHEVQVLPGTALARIVSIGASSANSFHIQAVQYTGAGLRVSARGEDGTIEALESEDASLLGVQFHPERLQGSVWTRLFEHLVNAARR